MAKRFFVAPIAVLFVVALTGCGSSGIGGASGASVSLDQEWQLGNQMAAQVAQQVHFVNDPVANNYVRAVGERIHAQTPLAGRPFDFHIVDVIIIVHRPRPLCNDRYQKRARESKKVTGNVGYSTLPARCLSPSFDTAPLAAQQHPLGSSRDASVTPIAK